MTDITDPQAKFLTAFARGVAARPGSYSDDLVESAKSVLATVDDPASTLVGELRGWEKIFRDEGRSVDARSMQDLAVLAGQVKQERDEARAEVERLAAERNTHSETHTQTETHTHSHSVNEVTDPADVKPGEVWSANIWYDDERHPGTAIKSAGGDWVVTRGDGSRTTYRMNEYVELVAPLVPEVDMTHILTEAAHDIATTFAETLCLPAAPRIITTPDELERLAATSIIRDGRGWPGGITDQGVIMINGFCLSDEDVLSRGPAMVLWEPGE